MLLNRILHPLLLLPLLISLPAYSDAFLFGDQAAEARHDFLGVEATLETASLGQACRRIRANGMLRFYLDAPDEGVAYLSLRLWGGETGKGQLYLFNGEDRIGGYLSSPPELDLLGEAPFAPGRFYYTTCLLPADLPRKAGRIEITIGSTGQPTPYSDHAKEARQQHPSRGIYGALLSSDPYPKIPEDWPEGAAPAAKKLDTLPAETQWAHLRAELDSAVEHLLTWQYYGPDWEAWVAEGKAPAMMRGCIVRNGVRQEDWTPEEWKAQSVHRGGVHVRCQAVPEIYAQAWAAPWSAWAGNPELPDRVYSALDFLCLAQGADGGFLEIEHQIDNPWIGGPNRKPGRGCLMGFGMSGPPAAFLLTQDAPERAKALRRLIDHDCRPETPPLPRRQAYAQYFEGVRCFLTAAKSRGHAPNQDMANLHAAWLADRALALLAPEQAWSAAEKQAWLDAAVGLAPGIYGARWISQQGVSCEPNGLSNGGYCGNYGSHIIAPLFDIARTTESQRYATRARQCLHALSWFHYPSQDHQGFPCWRREGVISWRNNHQPGGLHYNFTAWGALALQDKTARRGLQLALAHNHFAQVRLNPGSAHFPAQTRHWFHEMTALPEAARSIANPAPFPFEESTGTAAFIDPEAALVALRHGKTRLMMALNWRHGYRGWKRAPEEAVVNNLARIHYRSEASVRIATIPMKSNGGFQGLFECRYGPYHIFMNRATASQPIEVTSPAWQYLAGNTTAWESRQLPSLQGLILYHPEPSSTNQPQ